jgi:hypothetical protein
MYPLRSTCGCPQNPIRPTVGCLVPSLRSRLEILSVGYDGIRSHRLAATDFGATTQGPANATLRIRIYGEAKSVSMETLRKSSRRKW